MASEINYRDAVLERSDLALFAPPHWLNDRAIHFAMKLLEDDSTKSWLLLDPAVYAFLMLQCDFEETAGGVAGSATFGWWSRLWWCSPHRDDIGKCLSLHVSLLYALIRVFSLGF